MRMSLYVYIFMYVYIHILRIYTFIIRVREKLTKKQTTQQPKNTPTTISYVRHEQMDVR